jgi:histidyl-tRNA synthetase
MKKIIPSLKGTRDFYPEDMAVRNWLYSTLRQVSESFGYQEYEGPFLETLELYAAKSGDELVKEQSYVFPDRGGDLITLRPELTPTLVRMIAQRQQQLIFPLRWWSWGPFWRYERPQKGRTREFFQWNVDIIGVASPEADAEVVAVLATLFRSVGLTPAQAVIKVNNRRLIDSQLAALDIPFERRPAITRLIDRKDKMNPAEWDAYATEIGLTMNQQDSLKAILSNTALWRQSEELMRFFEAIQALGVGEYVQFDPLIIRGLDYYTGTVFEAQDVTGSLRRSLLGGGRYDNLMGDVGGEPLSGTGFAMGDVAFTVFLGELGLIPKQSTFSPADVLVTVFDEQRIQASFQLATELRQAGIKVACYPEATKLQKQFRYADRIGMCLAVVLGPDEMAEGKVTIKELSSGSQQTVLRQEAAQTIRKLLDSASPS